MAESTGLLILALVSLVWAEQREARGVSALIPYLVAALWSIAALGEMVLEHFA